MVKDVHTSFREYVVHHMLTVAALTALFLPLFGPVLDHHFTERQPDHGHVYLDGPDHEHLHIYETYDHHPPTSLASANKDVVQNGSVVVLTDSHRIGSGQAATLSYLQQLVRVVLQNEGDANRFAYLRKTASPTSVAIPTPKQPPRF